MKKNKKGLSGLSVVLSLIILAIILIFIGSTIWNYLTAGATEFGRQVKVLIQNEDYDGDLIKDGADECPLTPLDTKITLEEAAFIPGSDQSQREFCLFETKSVEDCTIRQFHWQEFESTNQKVCYYTRDEGLAYLETYYENILKKEELNKGGTVYT